MNKKEAVAYSIITLNYMQNSKYNGKLTPYTFSVEMKEAFKMYSRDIALIIAKSILEIEKECDKHE